MVRTHPHVRWEGAKWWVQAVHVEGTGAEVAPDKRSKTGRADANVAKTYFVGLAGLHLLLLVHAGFGHAQVGLLNIGERSEDVLLRSGLIVNYNPGSVFDHTLIVQPYLSDRAFTSAFPPHVAYAFKFQG